MSPSSGNTIRVHFADPSALLAVGYGSQGHGQGLNARDQGINIIVGVREGGQSWKEAIEDGWVSISSSRRRLVEAVGARRARHGSS